MRRLLTLWLPSLTVVVLLGGGSLATSTGAAAAPTTAAPRRPTRMLVISLPGVTWADLDPQVAPTLSRLVARSAVADLVTRADRQPASLGAAYVTIGAGTRSATAATDGDAVGTAERIGGTTGADAYRQRTGRAPGRGIVQLAIAQIVRSNAALLFDARVGALGDRLRTSGYTSAVVANADQTHPATSGTDAPVFERPAVSALMGADGRLHGGEVDPTLLTPDPVAPYGVRLDEAAVTGAFRRAWTSHSVVLVEGSDLERANRFATFSTSHHGAEAWKRALRTTDALVAHLLASVDLRRDAVMVVGPTSRSGARSLTVAALASPGTDPGLLQSASTRRAGFVNLTDIAPTILDTLGVPAPAAMEGRPMRVASRAGSAADRRAFLMHADEDGLQRDRLVEPVTKFVGWYAMVLAAATVLVLGRVGWAGRVLRNGALWLVGFVLGTFAVVPLHVAQHGGARTFWLFTILFASVFVAACRLLFRRGPLDPLIGALGLVVAVLALDNLTHDRLEFNAVFGYSPTVGIRLAGNGNAGFAVLGASAVVFAGLLAWRLASRRGRALAIAVLGVVFVSFTPPFFGQDFGGTLASAPAFLVLAWLLLGRRIRWRTVAAFAAVLVASGLVVGSIDLLRPHDQRTHVGRFFEQIGSHGWSGFTTVLQRKGAENAATLGQSLSILVIVVVLVAIVASWYPDSGRLRQAAAAVPTLPAVALSMAVLAFLGYALNDSGISIPALMAVIVAASVGYLAATAEVLGSGTRSLPSSEPAPPGEGATLGSST